MKNQREVYDFVFQSLPKEEKILVLMPFGSHLYGTDTERSDFDFKGIFLPTKDEALMGRIRRRISSRPEKAEGQKNAPGDVEWELLSLHEFLKMALEGQTMALDMLHAHRSMIWLPSLEWDNLQANRSRFYTKSLKAFVGYARRQAAKYGINGSRLHTARRMVDFLRAQGDLPVASVVDPILGSGLDHVHATDDPNAPIEILGKRLTALAKCSHYLGTFEKYLASYGSRAEAAERSEGVDWKAMSHAVRAAWEVRSILKGEDFRLPFDRKRADHLKAIKGGSLAFQEVQEELEVLIDEVESLSVLSSLPERPDQVWADWFLLACMRAL